MDPISVAKPKLIGNERKYVLDCLETNWISSNGKYINAFEDAFAKFCGVKYAVSTNNGTTALHLAMVALGLNPGDEVIIPTVTYIATANAVHYCGAKPVFVDVCENSLNINPYAIEQKITSKTRGIIPVHLYGHPADMTVINEIAQKYGLWVVEDAAEAHSAEVLGKKVGSLGQCATFSFFGNKIMTTGEGGIITTDDGELAEKMRLYRGQGMDLNRRYWFSVVGYNYRMTNIQAALGLAQLENIHQVLAERERVGEWYHETLFDLQDQIILPVQAEWAKPVYWMYNIFLQEGGDFERNQVINKLQQMGIETRPVFYPMHVLPPYREEKSYPVADVWAVRGINLPTHPDLSKKDIERIAGALKIALKNVFDKNFSNEPTSMNSI